MMDSNNVVNNNNNNNNKGSTNATRKSLTVFCPICDIRFDYMLLEQHIATVHIGARKAAAQWSCGTCGYEAWDFNGIGVHCINLKHSPLSVRRLPENTDRYWTSVIDVLQKITASAPATPTHRRGKRLSQSTRTAESNNNERQTMAETINNDGLLSESKTLLTHSTGGGLSDLTNSNSQQNNIISILSSSPAFIAALLQQQQHFVNSNNKVPLSFNNNNNNNISPSSISAESTNSPIFSNSPSNNSLSTSLSPPSPKKRTTINTSTAGLPPLLVSNGAANVVNPTTTISSQQEALLNFAAKYQLLQQAQQAQRAQQAHQQMVQEPGSNKDSAQIIRNSSLTTGPTSPTFTSPIRCDDTKLSTKTEDQLAATLQSPLTQTVSNGSSSTTAASAISNNKTTAVGLQSLPGVTNDSPRKLNDAKPPAKAKSATSSGRHPRSNMRKFDCHLCPFKSFSAATLRTHMNVHTNSRPFSCDFCGKRFNQSGNKYRHERRFCKVRRRIVSGDATDIGVGGTGDVGGEEDEIVDFILEQNNNGGADITAPPISPYILPQQATALKNANSGTELLSSPNNNNKETNSLFNNTFTDTDHKRSPIEPQQQQQQNLMSKFIDELNNVAAAQQQQQQQQQQNNGRSSQFLNTSQQHQQQAVINIMKEPEQIQSILLNLGNNRKEDEEDVEPVTGGREQGAAGIDEDVEDVDEETLKIEIDDGRNNCSAVIGC